MIWLISLAMLTTIFTVALTGRYKDQVIDLKQKLIDNDEKWNKEVFDLMNEHHVELERLEKELRTYRGR